MTPHATSLLQAAARVTGADSGLPHEADRGDFTKNMIFSASGREKEGWSERRLLEGGFISRVHFRHFFPHQSFRLHKAKRPNGHIG